jgi:hypothetical protein
MFILVVLKPFVIGVAATRAKAANRLLVCKNTQNPAFFVYRRLAVWTADGAGGVGVARTVC